jgi:hypothetical protein
VGTRPLVAGYMRAAMVVILADTAFQYHELKAQERKDQQVDDFYRSGVSGSFFEYGEAQASHSAYEFSKWMFYGRVAMDTAFMYAPMLKGTVSKIGAKLLMKEFMADVEAFRVLGLEPGNWKAVPGAKSRLSTPETTLELAGVEADLAAFRAAQARLMAKIAAKNTWELPTIREILTREEAFRVLELKNGTWEVEKIDRALTKKLKSRALGPEEKETAERCAQYLKIVLEADPAIATRELPEIPDADRKLVKALHQYDFRAVLKQVTK